MGRLQIPARLFPHMGRLSILSLMRSSWFVLLLGLALNSPASAAPNFYQVAVVVFSQPVDSEEDLLDQPEIPWPARWREAKKLPAAQSGLYNAYDRLRRSRSHHPLLHTAWIQPAGPNRVNPPYHVGSADGPVEGVVRLQRGEYLHVIVDMEYRGRDGLVHRLREKRRVKFNEIHYLDHPAFGVLIRVSPANASP